MSSKPGVAVDQQMSGKGGTSLETFPALLAFK